MTLAFSFQTHNSSGDSGVCKDCVAENDPITATRKQMVDSDTCELIICLRVELS